MDANKDIWRQYYEKALGRKNAPKTELALKLNTTGLHVAVDCGCGTGSEIAYMAEQGYRVHGFDMNPDAVAICHERFGDNSLVDVSEASFENFEYPEAGVIIANSSLFFAEPTCFLRTWHAIASSLCVGGVFAGDFMGTEDDWASGYRRETTPLAEAQVRELFSNFDIIRFHERNEQGSTALGRMKRWHTYTVVAVRRA